MCAAKERDRFHVWLPHTQGIGAGLRCPLGRSIWVFCWERPPGEIVNPLVGHIVSANEEGLGRDAGNAFIGERIKLRPADLEEHLRRVSHATVAGAPKLSIAIWAAAS